MNNIIIQSIRVAVVLVIAFFALVSDVFAAPILTPASATHITENSAKLVSSVSNPHKSTAVWFELIDGAGASIAVGAQPPLYDNGINVNFEHSLYSLNPGQTYKFRSVAMEGGVTVYSNPSSFTTKSPKTTVVTIVSQPNLQTVTSSSNTPASKTTVTKSTQEVTPTATSKQTTTTAPTATVVTEEGFTNRNSATVIGSGSDIFPSTLIGWLLLLLAILVVVLIGRMIFESTENRRKTRVEIETENE